MAWVKIPIQDQWQNTNDVNASGFVVKCYLPGTTTATPMAIDKNGVTTVSTATLNADGFPEVSGNEVALYIDREFKIAIYENATDASNDTNAFWGPVDNITISDLVGTFTSDYWVDNYSTLRAKTSGGYTDGDVITVTDDGIAGDFVVKTGTVTDNGGTLIVFTDDSNRYAERLFNEIVLVDWFEPDGLNDALAFQAALDTGYNVAAYNDKSWIFTTTPILRSSNQKLFVYGQILLGGASGTAALQIGDPASGYNVDYCEVYIQRIDGQDNTAGRDGIRYQYAVLCSIFVQRMIRVRYGHHFKMESASARFIHNTVRGEIISTSQIGAYFENASGGVTELDNEGTNIFINMITGSVVAGFIHEGNVRGNGIDLRCNFDAEENYYVNLSTFGQTNNIDCTDWPEAQTATGGTSDGSTAVITGLSDTSVFVAGCYVAVSAGFPSTTSPYKVVSVDSGTQITLDTNSDSVASGTITVSRQNFFTDRDNVRGDGLLRVGWRPFRGTNLEVHGDVDNANSAFLDFLGNGNLLSRIGYEANGNLLFRTNSGAVEQLRLRSDDGVQIQRRLIIDGEGSRTLSAGDNTITLATNENSLLCTADAAGSTITGLVAEPRGRQVTIFNNSGNTLTIGNEDTAETTAANRIRTGSTDIALGSYDNVTLRYVTGFSRWIVLSSVT